MNQGDGEITPETRIDHLRTDLAVALRLAARHGFHEGIDNHFSAATAEGRFLVNGWGKHWSRIHPEDILEVDSGGNILSGVGKWDSAAFTIHKAVHDIRIDARVVFHTHMPYATAVANTSDGLDTRLTQSAMLFHGQVTAIAYDGIAESASDGERLKRILAGTTASVILMRNHGVMVAGRSVAEAWYRLYMLERACQAQVTSLAMGVPLERVPAEIAAKTAAQFKAEEPDAAGQLFEAEAACLFQVQPEITEWMTGRESIQSTRGRIA
jgi:ribulose-5-phosphate 4-epimerase/fuculose-1-phosphate aldolase